MNATSPKTGYANRAIGAIATSLPDSAALFRRHHIDFFCDADDTLAEAAAAKGLSCAALETELAAIADAAATAPEQADNALIEQIETRYHKVHRREVPELIKLARHVEATHKDHPAAPLGMANLLEQILPELESHMQKEEQILFPGIRQGAGSMLAGPVTVMMMEHEEHVVALRKLKAIAHDFNAPDDACNSWRALYAGTQKFADDFVEHMHTENNILFPRYLD